MEGDSLERSARDLEDRFGVLIARLDLAPHADGVFPLLARCYSEAGRHYHTLAHIRDCLERLDEVGDRLDDRDAAELALWFHDAVYDPARDDNELRSALLFDQHLGIHLPTQRADRVHAMIMATLHTDDPGEDGDASYVVDIDLSSLGAPWPKFRHDSAQLRRESGHLTDDQFQTGTKAFFTRLLARPSVYLTQHFRTRYEAQARRNIEALLAGPDT